MTNRVDQGATIMQQVGPQVAVMADLSQLNIEEIDKPSSSRKSARQIVCVHVAGSDRRQPARGLIGFTSSFAALKEIGYDGYPGIECRVD